MLLVCYSPSFVNVGHIVTSFPSSPTVFYKVSLEYQYFSGEEVGGEELSIGGVAVPRWRSSNIYARSFREEKILTKILASVLEWDNKNERMLIEYCVIRKFQYHRKKKFIVW